jgi:hypothetical protein
MRLSVVGAMRHDADGGTPQPDCDHCAQAQTAITIVRICRFPVKLPTSLDEQPRLIAARFFDVSLHRSTIVDHEGGKHRRTVISDDTLECPQPLDGLSAR